MSETQYTRRLSKSRFVAGCQCLGYLWWKVHEHDAPELIPDKALQYRFDQGHQVGALARTRFPGGVLIDLPHNAVEARVAETAAALKAGALTVFEASFLADHVFVMVDVLERTNGGFNMIEVKATKSLKDEHIPDATIQTHVLQRCGIDVARSEIMHLNSEYRHPEGELFQRTDVTAEVAAYLPQIAAEIEEQLRTIHGPRPEEGFGPRCHKPRKCPFLGRCWPDDPNHISALYRVGPKKTWEYMQAGVDTIPELPADTKLSDVQKRQIRAQETGEMVVVPGLAEALAPFSGRLGFLDFETVGPAIPVWPGLAPWGSVPAQFSYHEESPDGTVSHKERLADGPDDPRRALARALVDACAGADKIAMYTTFEVGCIRKLREAVPELAEPLQEIEEKLIDLKPVVVDHVYHPDFGGSFSIKDILTPLVPELSYDDLPINDGNAASAEIARLLLEEDTMPDDEREQLRHDLLEYCKQDTWAMVMLVRRLRELAAS
jgi:hypothetical protein